MIFARTLLPLVQLPPAGHWGDARRPRFVLDPRPLPDARGRRRARPHPLPRGLRPRVEARRRRLVRRRPARLRLGSRRAPSPTATSTGTELLDLPDAPLPPADTPLPPRFLAHWDQPLLAYADRDRIIPPEVRPLKLTLSGDPTVTVDGRVAASWNRWTAPRLDDHPARGHCEGRASRDPRGSPAHCPLLRARSAHATKSCGREDLNLSGERADRAGRSRSWPPDSPARSAKDSLPSSIWVRRLCPASSSVSAARTSCSPRAARSRRTRSRPATPRIC